MKDNSTESHHYRALAAIVRHHYLKGTISNASKTIPFEE